MRKPTINPYPGGAIGPGRISAEQRAKLADWLPARWNAEKRELFLDAAATEVGAWELGTLPVRAPYRETIDAWADLRAGATQMLSALAGLNDSHYHRLQPYFNELALASDPAKAFPLEIRYLLRRIARSGEHPGLHELLFDYLWNALEAVRETVIYADAERPTLTAQMKAGENVSRSFVYHVADAHRRAFGTLPPTTESGWFVPFVCELPEALGIGISFGARLVRERLLEMQKADAARA